MAPGSADKLVRTAGRLAAAAGSNCDIRKLEESITYCEQALKIEPKNLDAVILLASLHLRLGHLRESADSYRLAISLNPRVALFHQSLGLVLLRQSLTDEAERSLLQSVALNSSGAALSYSGLAQIAVARGDHVKAASLLRQVYECDPRSAGGQFSLARASFLEGDLDDSVRILRELIRIKPEFGEAYRLLGQILQQQGHFDEAEKLARISIELDPNAVQAFKAIVDGRRMTNQDRDFIERAATLSTRRKISPDEECSLCYALGKARDDLGEYETAIREYDKANELAAKMHFKGRPFEPARLSAIYDQAKSLFTKEFFAKSSALGSESEMPVFIVGMMRSGTTLTEQIVSSHPAVGAGGELSFWINRAATILDPATGRIQTDRLRQAQADYLAQLSELGPRKLRVTDKRPGNRNLLGYIHLAFPKAKIIHCKRDAVDNALSIYMTPSSAPMEYGYVRENIVFAFKEYKRLMELYASVLPAGTILDVSYEELVAAPETVTRRIIAFLGLEWNEACLRHQDNERAIATPSMWQARQPIYATSVKRWKNYEPWLGPFKDLMEAG